VLLTSVEGYRAAGFGDSLIIIDNSPDRRIVGDDRIKGMVGEVIATRARLTFSQSQNYIAGTHLILPFASMPMKASTADLADPMHIESFKLYLPVICQTRMH
jgi:hypothetical protein